MKKANERIKQELEKIAPTAIADADLDEINGGMIEITVRCRNCGNDFDDILNPICPHCGQISR